MAEESRHPTPMRKGINMAFVVAIVFLAGWLILPQIQTVPRWSPVVIAVAWIWGVISANIFRR